MPPGRAKQEGVSLLTGHFVVRADELASLERILDELDRGCLGALEVAGDPGIGKIAGQDARLVAGSWLRSRGLIPAGGEVR